MSPCVAFAQILSALHSIKGRKNSQLIMSRIFSKTLTAIFSMITLRVLLDKTLNV